MSDIEPSNKRQKLSQTSINNSIDSVVLSQALTQKSDKNSPFSPLNNLSNDQIIIIRKNDNIKKRINQLLKLLKNSSEEFMLISQSTNIQKLLSILEIVKQKIKDQENMMLGDEKITLKHNNYVQYNRLDSVKSRQNPKYKTREVENPQENLKPLRDDEAFTAEQLKELGIAKEKIYKIPILYVYLKTCNTAIRDESLTSNGWTHQC